MRARMRLMAALLLVPGPVQAQMQAQEAELFDAAGYRIAHYRGPVHRPPEGVGRIAPAAIAGLRPDIDMILIDVLPAEGGHRAADGRWQLAQPHESIPGAHWFPESGRGAPTPDITDWFARGVARLTGGKRDRMIVTFCRADCWMGWNAARRLRVMGYRNIWWLAEGTDGWRDLGRELKPVQPARR